MTRFTKWEQMLDYMKAMVSDEDTERTLVNEVESKILIQMVFDECADFGYNFIGDMKDRIYDGACTATSMAYELGLARGIELERERRYATVQMAASSEASKIEALADLIEAFRRLVPVAA